MARQLTMVLKTEAPTAQEAVLLGLFQTHSTDTEQVTRLLGGDRKKALRVLNGLVKLGAVARAQNEWNGHQYETRRRVARRDGECAKFAPTVWQVNVEPDPTTDLDTVRDILTRVRAGECFNTVTCALGAGC